MSIVVDIETLRHGCHERSLIEFGPDGAIVPIETLRRRLCLSERAVILMRDGVGLAMGRERRVATRDQRTMARAMYPTCAIARCEVAFERCELHHIIWWRHGGTTDLANLVPLCSKHHHCAHEGGWQLALDPGHPGPHRHLPRRHDRAHAAPASTTTRRQSGSPTTRRWLFDPSVT